MPGALGTDTGGSVRIPACFCGVTGLRPTTGRVSTAGVVPVSWTYDTVGPLARSAEDCALLLEAIAGHDRADPGSARVPVPRYTEELGGGIDGLRVGVVSHLLDEALVDPRVAAAAESAIAELAALGARVEQVDAAFVRRAEVVQQLVMLPEAAEAHLRWLRTRYADYGPGRAGAAPRRAPPACVGADHRSARASRSRRARRGRSSSGSTSSSRPQMPVVAPRIDDLTVEVGGERVPYRTALIPFNSPWSCLGLPVVSVPCGFVDGLPVGLALVGRRFDESTVLRAAHAYQEATDWHERRPPLAV